jgi:hypothetical protein
MNNGLDVSARKIRTAIAQETAGAAGAAGALVKQPPIPAAIEHLQAMQERTHDLLSRLERRLEDVSQPVPCDPETKAIEPPAGLLGAIEQRTASAAAMNTRLERMLDGLLI